MLREGADRQALRRVGGEGLASESRPVHSRPAEPDSSQEVAVTLGRWPRQPILFGGSSTSATLTMGPESQAMRLARRLGVVAVSDRL